MKHQLLFFRTMILSVLFTAATAQFGPPHGHHHHHGHHHGNPHGHHRPRPNRPPLAQPAAGFPHGPESAAIPNTAAGQVPLAPTVVPVTSGTSPIGNAPVGNNNNLGGLVGLLNGGNFGSASAGGAGNGAVQNGAAIGQGTGIANAGPGGFGIGLGIGGAIATPLGNLAFGTGESLAVGKK